MKDQERLDELIEKINDRQAAREAEEAAAREAEERAAREAEEAADDAELELLKAKADKRKKKFTKLDQARLNELTEKINARIAAKEAAAAAAAAAEAEAEDVDEDDDDDSAILAAAEAEELATREAEEAAAREAEEKAAEDAAQAAREAEEQAAREKQEAEAAAPKKKSKKSSKSDEKKSKSSSKDKKKELPNDDDFDMDNLDLTTEQADEFLAALEEPPKKPKEPTKASDPFSFWGAAKVPPKSPIPEAAFEHASPVDTAPVTSKSSFDDWMPKKKSKASKLADKLKKFEPAPYDDPEDDLIDVLPEAPPPPPPPPPPPSKSKKNLRKNQRSYQVVSLMKTMTTNSMILKCRMSSTTLELQMKIVTLTPWAKMTMPRFPKRHLQMKSPKMRKPAALTMKSLR
ncbi:hypothetical protein F4808DRAFT_56411 [Astrocystis sublimbata]|nr:hypothetical protein F4808DRAFT_56411 [Astrocystis sublimbata]